MAYNSIYMVKSSSACTKGRNKKKSMTSSTYVIHNSYNNLKKNSNREKHRATMQSNNEAVVTNL